ncbi:hypothetical protein BB560_003531 [Smittium megazygosporum]|uniref:Cyclin n=1 Tax=Smittium megazygosporum TaxID=133381 RepID=A0A2T9ZBQ2_9FUNG|nr:hypothetical protein BB560_003531 [Smittium megazygosporum]
MQSRISSDLLKGGFKLESVNIKDVIILASFLLTNIVRNNDLKIISTQKTNLTPFNSKTIPKISIESYLERLAQKTDLNADVIILAIVLLIRCKSRTLAIKDENKVQNECSVEYPNEIQFFSSTYSSAESYTAFHSLITSENPLYSGFFINSYNIHRILLTTITIAQKISSDFFYKNSCYAKVGGISTTELNFLEMEILFILKFNLYVTKSEQTNIGTAILRKYIESQYPNPLKTIRLISSGTFKKADSKSKEIFTF